jgi:tetratricopeptide (TPR) repeat protein
MEQDMPDAIHQYQMAVGIKDDSAMETNLANAYEQVKDFDDAIKTYRHAIELNTQNASAHCNLGYALMQLGRVDDAIPEFMETIREDPRMPQGRGDLAQALKIKGINPEDPNAPAPGGKYSFDVNEALQLLRSGPMPDQPPG